MERFKTTKAALEFLERLTRTTGIRRNVWSRGALGWSLSLEDLPDEKEQLDSDGMEHTRQMIFGEDEPTLLALLRQRYQGQLSDERLRTLVKVHVERGLRLLRDQYERLNRRGDELLLFLLRQCAGREAFVEGSRPHLEPTVSATADFALALELGTVVGTTQPVVHTLTGSGDAPHVAVMGRNATGKTRIALTLLSQIGSGARHPVPFLIFDYAKGDIGANQDFIASTGGELCHCQAKRSGLHHSQ